MGPPRTKHSVLIWIAGIFSCFVFLWALLPMSGPPGHQWVMPLGLWGALFFGGGSFAILVVTYAIDRYLGRKKKDTDES